MNDHIIQKLSALFERLPGIGPRQAKRFVYALLDEKEDVLKEFSESILNLKSNVKRCTKCFRAFQSQTTECPACMIGNSHSSILIVEKDADLESIEKAGVYDGLFHVLGGVISPLNPASQERLHLRELFDRVKNSPQIKEVIVATSATSEGDSTSSYIERILEVFIKERGLKISRLGRGLSTGSYLEFSDTDTLRNALNNRK